MPQSEKKQPGQPQPQQRSIIGLLFAVVAVGLLAASFAILLRQADLTPGHSARGGLGPGSPLPAIRAEGWINGSDPTSQNLKGKVVVVDAWAYWCGPCLAAAPELVGTYERFHDQGVVFLGLTRDHADHIDDMKEFISQGKIPWPCGYGANETLTELGAEFIPQVWVVGADGKIRWNFDADGHLDDAIEDALAAAKVVDTPKAKR